MKEGTQIFLAILIFSLLILALAPSWIGVAGSITIGESFENVWFGLGRGGQTIILVVVLIAVIALLIGSKKG